MALQFHVETPHRDHYRVNAFGKITAPGKFEGCFDFAPHYYELALAGYACDEDAYGNWLFNITHEEWHKWPTLQGVKVLVLGEDEQGFVHHELRRQRGRL